MQSVQDGLRLKSIPPCRAYHIAGMLKIVLADKNGAWTWSLRGLIWEFICAFRENNNHSKPAPACTTTFPCCCTGGQGGVSWAPSSPWVVETEKKKKRRGPLCKDHRDGSVQDLLQQQPFSWWFFTAAYRTTNAATSPPIRLTEGVLFFKSQEEAKIRKAALLWLCLSQPTITHSVERHITGLSHRSGSQSQWLLRGISHETIRKTTVRDANFIFIHLISFTQVIFILF